MSSILQISPRILKSFATIFFVFSRIIMEFIDNSVDAAERFYIPETNSYSKNIEITIELDGNSHEYARLIIKDNCTGIKDLSKLLSSVGSSSKIEEISTNGQFGFGIYSFLALCKSLTINTKHLDNSYVERVKLNASALDVPESQGAQFTIEKIPISTYEPTETPSPRTWIILENFDKERFKDIDIKILWNEIQKHFELILRRNNIKITVIDFKRRRSDGNQTVHYCLPFNYESFDGISYEKTLTELEYIKGKKHSSVEKLDISSTPVKIFLRILSKKSLDRKPVFIIKGRRIAEVSDIKDFKTFSKNQIWSNSNVTGYIDVTGIVQPDISRTGFQQSVKTKALFYTLLKLEGEIKDAITSCISANSASDFKLFEDELKKALKNLTNKKKRNNQKKQNNNSDKNSKLEKGKHLLKKDITINAPVLLDTLVNSTNETKGEDYLYDFRDQSNTFSILYSERINSNDESNNLNNLIQKRISDQREQVTLSIYEKSKAVRNNENPEDSMDANSFNLDGIGIKLDKQSEPRTDENDKPLRSTLLSGNIIIYMKHPLFQERLTISEDGFQRITSDIITYFAAEIITQYMILSMSDNTEEPSDLEIYTKHVLWKYVELLHNYIIGLKHLEGKKLSELSA